MNGIKLIEKFYKVFIKRIWEEDFIIDVIEDICVVDLWNYLFNILKKNVWNKFDNVKKMK